RPLRVAGLPPWVLAAGGFAGALVVTSSDRPNDLELLIRTAVPTPEASRMVVADLPVDSRMIARLQDRTGTRIRTITATGCGAPAVAREEPPRGALFRETVAFMDCFDWPTGRAGGVSIGLEAPVGDLYDRLAAASSIQVSTTIG